MFVFLSIFGDRNPHDFLRLLPLIIDQPNGTQAFYSNIKLAVFFLINRTSRNQVTMPPIVRCARY